MTALFGSNRRISSLAMTDVGHEDPFPPHRLNARCPLSKETFAGTRGNGRDAPISAIRQLTPQDRRGSTRKPPFPHARPAIDTVSSMLHPSARGRVALC